MKLKLMTVLFLLGVNCAGAQVVPVQYVVLHFPGDVALELFGVYIAVSVVAPISELVIVASAP